MSKMKTRDRISLSIIPQRTTWSARPGTFRLAQLRAAPGHAVVVYERGPQPAALGHADYVGRICDRSGRGAMGQAQSNPYPQDPSAGVDPHDRDVLSG